MIGRLHHVEIIIPRGKEEDARAFYCGFLGLAEIEKPSPLKERGGLWLELGNAEVHLSINDGYDPRTTKAHIAYEVENLSSLKKQLAAKGVEIKDGATVNGLIRCHIRDPFGNRIEFVEFRRRGTPYR